ncbi:MAG: site-specific integrase [Firmicutes bacterium]|nr:site-specific integrase [Bacillota bacterium]
MPTKTHAERRLPFETHFEFTVAKLKQVARAVQEIGIKQVELCCKTDRGLRAFVYGKSVEITLFSRYNLRKQPKRIRLGKLGQISLEQARQKHREIRLAAEQGIDPKSPKKSVLTFAELHDQHYMVECKSRQKKTLHTDQSRYNHWLGPEFGHLPLTEITSTLVSQFVIRMQEAQLAPATVKKIVVQLRSCLSLAVDLDFIEKNVAKRIRLPKVNNRRATFLTVQQMAAFMKAAQACHADELVGSRMLMLMALTGARLGEVTNAKWEHIQGDHWILPTQKSGVPGAIPITAPAVKSVIAELVAVRFNEYLHPGARGNPTLSRPIKLFKRICKAAGLGDQWRIHDLRHAWISAGVFAHIPLETLSQCARHSTPTVTRIYSHPHQESMEQAHNQIAALYFPENEASHLDELHFHNT